MTRHQSMWVAVPHSQYRGANRWWPCKQQHEHEHHQQDGKSYSFIAGQSCVLPHHAVHQFGRTIWPAAITAVHETGVPCLTSEYRQEVSAS